jgi:hypothetical protein
MEEGGFCCFTNSLPEIYLRMWLNENKPHMTSFVSHKIPDEFQLATTESKTKQKSTLESIAEAFTSFVQLRHKDQETVSSE